MRQVRLARSAAFTSARSRVRRRTVLAVPSYDQRKALQRRAIAELQAATATRPEHPGVLFHAALALADVREVRQLAAAAGARARAHGRCAQLDAALELVRRSLAQDRGHAPSWNLLAVLLSSRKQVGRACVRAGAARCTRALAAAARGAGGVRGGPGGAARQQQVGVHAGAQPGRA